jgi:hypothetical protein
MQIYFAIYLSERTEFFSHMTARPIFPKLCKRFTYTAIFYVVLMVMVLSMGCMTTQVSSNQSGVVTQLTTALKTPKSIALYSVTIPQPENSNSDLIQLDSDIYNLGEVIDFSLITDRNATLPTGCDILSFRVFIRNTDGIWKEIPGPFRANIPYRSPQPASTSYPGPGPSIPEYRLVTTGWIPGYYKIQSDCLRASHEFILRDIPLTNKS